MAGETGGSRRERERERDAAAGVVDAAWRDGRIVAVDHRRRREELARARSSAEIEMLTHDLRRRTAATGHPVATPDPDGSTDQASDDTTELPAIVLGDEPDSGAQTRRNVPRWSLIIPAVIALAVVGSAVALAVLMIRLLS